MIEPLFVTLSFYHLRDVTLTTNPQGCAFDSMSYETCHNISGKWFHMLISLILVSQQHSAVLVFEHFPEII